LAISNAIIILCSQIGKRYPTFAGLIATMPLTGLVILVWLYTDNPGDFKLMERYTQGALWGIIPSILFFLVAYFCFHKQMPLSVALPAAFSLWIFGAALHQLLLR